MRVGICIPSSDHWKADFGLSLAKMTAHFVMNWPDKTAEFGIHNFRSSILPSSRNALVEWAQETEATHVLFLDDDMLFPPDTLNRLLEHKKPIVAANCVTREFPAKPTATKDEVRVYTEEGSEGLEEVHSIGTAIMLIDMKVFESIDMPYFAFSKHPFKPNRCRGEDTWFCKRARTAGYQIFIDHGLSQEVGHIGQQVFTQRMARFSRDRGELDEFS